MPSYSHCLPFLLLLSILIHSIMLLCLIIYEWVAIETFRPMARGWCESGSCNLCDTHYIGRKNTKASGDIVAIIFCNTTNSTMIWLNSETKYGYAINAFTNM